MRSDKKPALPKFILLSVPFLLLPVLIILFRNLGTIPFLWLPIRDKRNQQQKLVVFDSFRFGHWPFLAMLLSCDTGWRRIQGCTH